MAILYLSLTCSLLGYYIWFYVLKKAGPSITSSFLFAEPLITGLLAVTLIGEQITPSLIAGGLIIFLGVYLITRN
jgi:drug/metabolite transporter (DMT)-like permease